MADRALGLAGADRDGLRARVAASWDAFVALAEATDLSRPTRLPGWTAHDVCVHLGTWDDNRPLQGVLASARAGGTGRRPDTDADNARLVAAHRGASDAEVRGALARSRDLLQGWLGSPEEQEWGLAPSVSLLGPLPVLTLVHAGCYELAVHGLDLAAAGGPAVPEPLLQAGLAALVDVTGALAASRRSRAARVAAVAPEGGWRFQVEGDGWRTEAVPPGAVQGTAVLGSTADLLEVSAGRAAAPALLAARRIRVQDLRGFLQLAPLVESVPGLPGGAALRTAARTLGAAAGVLGRVPGLRPRG